MASIYAIPVSPHIFSYKTQFMMILQQQQLGIYNKNRDGKSPWLLDFPIQGPPCRDGQQLHQPISFLELKRGVMAHYIGRPGIGNGV
ncbi:hypothetical protein OUZ56_016010 [Daphnia magna]|uniref:Uncharacterized protein n=1 Tax=Daphnia magna TaxID=35525 RepID=A0ABR0APD5_9CRUS|nr:hypothetical protein OUZ56_016010 [Daphnia magna]